MKTLQHLIDTLPQVGTVEWIGLRPARREAMNAVASVYAEAGQGLEGDRYRGRSGKRDITLIQSEHLAAIASCLGLPSVAPEQLRRNIVVRGVNLLAFRTKVMQIGEVKVLVTGLCHPCSRMEEILGPGGYNAMRGHGGVTARVIEGGSIVNGSSVSYLDDGVVNNPNQ